MNISDVQKGDVLINSNGLEYTVFNVVGPHVSYAWTYNYTTDRSSVNSTQTKTHKELYWVEKIRRGDVTHTITPKIKRGDKVENVLSGSVGIFLGMKDNGVAAVSWDHKDCVEVGLPRIDNLVHERTAHANDSVS